LPANNYCGDHVWSININNIKGFQLMPQYSVKKFEDSTLNTLTAKQGYYQVDDKYYHCKINALLEASRTKKNVSWNFNYNIYSEQANRARLNVHLDILYRERARQLREQYDYLIIAFSGGADSDTVLKTFLDNNIKIDEVWVDWHHIAIEKSGYKLNFSKDPSNMPSEWFLVIKPELDKLRISHPEIKIRITDSVTDVYTPLDTKNSRSLVNDLSSVGGNIRRNNLDHYVKSISNGKNVAVVMGMDKLIPYSNEKEYGIIFSDGATCWKSSGFEQGDCILEYFYWSPDFPEIVTEQGHLVWDHLLVNPEFTKIRMAACVNGVDSTDRDKVFDNIIKKICYPKWDFSKHQVNKGKFHAGTTYSYLHKWKNESLYQANESLLTSYFNIIDDRFIDPHNTSVKELKFFYNFHKLGNMPSINT
jgi:hypothetical protein